MEIFISLITSFENEKIKLLISFALLVNEKEIQTRDSKIISYFFSYVYVVESILVYKSVGYRRNSME